MMINVDSLWFIMGIPAIIGFLLETKLRDVVKPLAIMLSIPTILWLYFLASTMMNAPNNSVEPFSLIQSIFNENFEILILSYAGGAIGTGCAKALFK